MQRITAPDLPRGELLRRLRAQVAGVAPRAELPVVPVHPTLAGLFPHGGLRPGGAYSLGTTGALLTTLLAEPSKEGTWCGVVGIPEFGVEAAAKAGVDLERLALVPDPGGRWLAVTAALLDVLPVVALRPEGSVGSKDAARLASRLRDRGAILLVAGEWPQSLARVAVAEPRWSGLGEGHGVLETREVTVTVTSRTQPMPRSVRLVLPAQDGRPRSLEAVSQPPLRAVG